MLNIYNVTAPAKWDMPSRSFNYNIIRCRENVYSAVPVRKHKEIKRKGSSLQTRGSYQKPNPFFSYCTVSQHARWIKQKDDMEASPGAQ
jgi:hypothetical protein